jgi:hypothetical protein
MVHNKYLISTRQMTQTLNNGQVYIFKVVVTKPSILKWVGIFVTFFCLLHHTHHTDYHWDCLSSFITLPLHTTYLITHTCLPS